MCEMFIRVAPSYGDVCLVHVSMYNIVDVCLFTWQNMYSTLKIHSYTLNWISLHFKSCEGSAALILLNAKQ